MIKVPTKLRIYSPVMLANIDFTAEPELEGKTGSTYRGVAIADGGHAINAADGFPGHVLTVDQAPNGDAFNIEYAMTLIKKINSVVLDGHNLLSIYAASLRDSFKIKHSATDVLGVLVENEVRYSGLLGKERAFSRYDGLTAKTVVSDDDNLDFGNGNGAWFVDFTTRDIENTNPIISRFLNGSNYFTLWQISDTQIQFQIFAGGTHMLNARATFVWESNTRYRVVCSFVNGVSNFVSINGVEITLDVSDITTGGNMDIAADLHFAERSGVFSQVDIHSFIPYNRDLAPKEIEQMMLGVPVPFPLLIGDNSSFNTIGDWTENGNASFAAGVATMTGDGTANNNIVTATNLQTTLGNRYKLEYEITANSLSGGTSLTQLKTGANSANEIFDNQFLDSSVGEHSVTQLRRTGGTGIATFFQLQSIAASGTISIDNVYITDLDTKVTFPLLVDQWGGGTLNVSTIVNGGGANAMTTFSGASATGATIGSTGAGGVQHWCGTADEIPVEIGRPIFVKFTMGAGAGTLPDVDLVDSLTGSSISAEGKQQTVISTDHYFVFHPTSTTTAVVRWESAIGESFSSSFSALQIGYLGAVAAYLDDGISADQGKLLDGSSNNMHGIYTDVESIDAPAGDERGFVVSQFDEITNHKFWQMIFNEDLDDALLDILIGQVAGCWYRDYEIAAGGFKGRQGFPGVNLGMNESGRDNPEQKFGEKPDWDLTLRVTDDEGINDLEEFVRTVSGALLPAWITFDPPTDNNLVREPVFERVTLVESVFPWEFKFGQTLPWQVGLKFSRRLD